MPKVQFDNPEGAKFCIECGHKFGEQLAIEGERKQVTVLFSDLSGYTAMSERLDPEEVKNIISRIFGEIAQVVVKYDGSIEKFIGDAVVAFFGVPKAHEDDPVRAIRAAREIHEIVNAMSHQFESKVGKPLSMHTGINTGLVVTGEVTMEKGTLGVTGDAVNVASRLSGLAKPGEILVGEDTYRQAVGLFNFAPLTPVSVKGKAEPIRAYKVLSPKEEPTKIHRLSGMRADLIGRTSEMVLLSEAVNKLREGKGSIFSICGDAGTGKSRLIEEFKATLALKNIQWLEGHAYAYSQNIPYFPLINLLSRAWQIHEGDQPGQVKQKVETGSRYLIGDREDLVPYVGSLYSLSYPEIEQVSPEYWKARLHEAIQLILANFCKKSPTIICIEDLHWADPSSLELLRNILLDFRHPALFLCIYRLTLNLFNSHQVSSIKSYNEIGLQDLSPSDAQSMVESLLKTEAVPGELKKFILDKVEGNPFYLEEVINSLLEAGALIKKGEKWTLTKSIEAANIPSTVQGVITARLDRLEKETKHILQEASVIGRVFLYEILRRITEIKDQIDRSIMSLERLDFIRTRSIQPDLEYIFKHALTQEVVYNGLLKKERQNIHEKIGRVIEDLFKDRLPEFYETLAYHFKQGRSTLRAAEYLMKAGHKCRGRYAIEETHQYYKDAFDILYNSPNRSKMEDTLLVDILIMWSVVFSIRGDYKGLSELLEKHVTLAESLGDEERLGMVYAWLSFGVNRRMRLRDAYQYSLKAIKIGDKTRNQLIIGYASLFMAFTCMEAGPLDEAVNYAEKATDISLIYESDTDLFRFAWTARAMAYYYKGESRQVIESGNRLLEHAQKWSDIRNMTMGYSVRALGYHNAGDLTSAIDYCQKAIQVSLEPLFTYNAKLILGMCYVAAKQFQEAEKLLEEIMRFGNESGYEYLRIAAQAFQGIVMVTKGDLSQGIKIVENAIQDCLEQGIRYRYAVLNHMLGKVYLQIAQGGSGEKSFSFILKNIGFLIKTIPFAARKAEGYLHTTIETAKEIGAKSLLGQAYLDLGRLHKAKGRLAEARTCISQAVQSFEECEADVYLKQAREALASLG